MRKYSSKRNKVERNLSKIRAELYSEMIDEQGYICCQGCKRTGLIIECSHRIPRSRSIELIDDKKNIDLYCRTCHRNIEAGNYDLLLNGEEVKKYIKEKDIEYYQIKTLKNA